MKKRQLEIVRQILENQRPVSVQQLMKTYNKSERSIRYDVLEIRDQLNQYGIVLKNISGEGYYIDKNSRMACRSLLDSGRMILQPVILILQLAYFACCMSKAGI